MNIVKVLIERLGGGYARALNIDLASGEEREIFKWFLASFLYGARISESIASKTYREFEREGVLSPEVILERGWERLVQILDRGGYVRYDFSTATRLLELSKNLLERYEGRLVQLHSAARDPRDLEKRLQALGKGIGPVTVNIFLRELRGIWAKAEPLPSDPAIAAARHLDLVPYRMDDRQEILALLRSPLKRAGLQSLTFVDFEAALVRVGLRFCRKEKHAGCPMAPYCRSAPGEKNTR